MEKREELYRGKAKTVYATDDADLLWLTFRNDTSAFDGQKVAQLERKGEVNNKINAFIMGKLEAAGIRTHFVRLLSDTESLVRKLTMIPVECVVRNVVAGSMSKRLGIPEGQVLPSPIFEFFYKSDALHDPMVNDAHVEVLGWATSAEIAQMKALTFRVNDVLKPLFAGVGITLVDYKLEFGNDHGQMLLGDEFTPDGCRLWDATTQEKMDKDRFRRDLGNVIGMYTEVGRRLGVSL
ncbi:MAG: phosphoribosylaminoimidazolesuccinocarboxamide synthase [Betaproteobacteria bacterium]